MSHITGSIGTKGSFALRLGQSSFSGLSLFFMSLGVKFYSYTAFCFLVTVMGLVIPWSFTLTLLDAYFIYANCSIRQTKVLQVVILGDAVLSFLTIAAASSTVGILDVVVKAEESFCLPTVLCSRYLMSAAMALLSWFLLLASCLSNLWLLASLLSRTHGPM